MSSVKRWSGVQGQFSIELRLQPEVPFGYEVVRDWDDNTMPLAVQELRLLIEGENGSELVIYFQDSGHYDPGCHYLRNGDPGYPPESSNERAYFMATLDKKRLPDDLGQRLFDALEDQINEVVLDAEDYDPPEPDCEDGCEDGEFQK